MLHKGKRAIVTGAADGIGRATSLRLYAEGAQILAVDVNLAGLESLQAVAPQIEILVQDIADEQAAATICEVALTKLSGVDFLVNIAGVVAGPESTVESQSFRDWQRVLNVNLNAVFSLCQQSIPILKKSSRGRIINTGSIMSSLAGVGMGAYTASKHAIAGLTKTLALELGSHGITSNYILPGAIITGITKPAMLADPDFEKVWAGKSPMGRMGNPEDIANGINFLLSEDANFITGHGLVIDGGVMQSA